MNFVKRAGLSCAARKSRTAGLLGIFVVIGTLLLGGFHLRATAAAQEAHTGRTIGVDVTLLADGLTPETAGAIAASAVVTRHTLELPVRADPVDVTPRTVDAPTPEPPAPDGEDAPADDAREDTREDGPLVVTGVPETDLLLPFSHGSARITAGRALNTKDTDRRVAMVEQRLAAENGLGVGDTLRLRGADGSPVPLEVVGIFRDPAPEPAGWAPPHELPGNTLYVPVSTAVSLGADEKGTDRAVFRIGSPEDAALLHEETERLLGAGTFETRVNDKAFRDQVRPVQRVGSIAGLVVNGVVVAGALVLGLVVMAQMRERRHEAGVLLAMGEKRWKLLAQHLVEVAAVALPAVLLATSAGSVAIGVAGDALPGPPPDAVGPGPGAGPESGADPGPGGVGAATVARAAGVGLGISLVSTVVPGLGLLRLHPRSLLTDTD
ncbi:ABC transporter permease [Streptomyces bohaiensis]|uniref:ABC transporter permease n=1 Tax=Streptomyces bohaiensis TaxID=1431344 RepID=A0ABX1CF38_9ACTN|nr:ABC transporter permease [Streptomyces bohaiensis]NJQ15834.1 ABC transporter permease [Streptomyces bohaiensis]